MPLRKSLLAQLLLSVSLLGSFGFLGHYRGLYFQEIASLCTLLLFIWLTLSAGIRKSTSWLIYLPGLGIGLLIILYAYVFSARTGAPVQPSILAQRDYVFFLLAPVIYMLYGRGWRMADFQRILLFAAVLTIAGFGVAQFTVDLEAWAYSGDLYKESSVTYDDWRGYRLKGPVYLLLFVVLYAARRTLQARNLSSFMLRSGLMALPLILLIINSPRVTIMATIAALVLFMVFFSRAKYASLLQVAFPVFIVAAVLALLYFFSTFTTAFSSDYSYTTRVDSAERAWSVLLRYPLLGFGQDSQQSISYQEVIGPYFHPLDIGLLGIAFQFGVIGVALYLMFSVWIVVNMLSLWQRNRGQAEPAQVAFLWAMCILFLAWLVASPLQANFILAENIPIVALAWGLSMIHKHGTASRFPLTERSAGHPRPVTAT